MKMVRMLLLAAAIAMPAEALVQAYSVEPVKAAWSGWTSLQAPGNRVSEIVTCCWDELDSVSGGYVQLFTGLRGAGGNYNIEILEAGDEYRGHNTILVVRSVSMPGLHPLWSDRLT